MDQSDKVDVIVIGAGPSGLACAYTLAKRGIEVLVLERGSYPGSKNMFGGIFFSSLMEKILPEFIEEAPWERYVSKRRFSMLVDDSDIAFEMKSSTFNSPPYNHSFLGKRSKIDRWFAQIVENVGADIICNYNVDNFLYDNGNVVGITSGGEEDSIFANVIVCAEGANSILAEKAGLSDMLTPSRRSLAVKENIALPEKVINDRFQLNEKEGAAYEYFGSSVEGLLGNGFIYTNKDSLSVGVGFSLKDLIEKNDGRTPNDVLENFKNHPSIKPLIKDGETIEYIAHMMPCEKHGALPKLYRDGLLLVGDAAGLVNTSFFHEGINLAMASGIYAAETIIAAKEKNDYSSRSLCEYQNKLNGSFVMDDLKNCKNFISFLDSHRHFINEYPSLANDVLTEYFKVSEKSKKSIKKDIFHKIRNNIKLTRLPGDLWGAFRDLI